MGAVVLYVQPEFWSVCNSWFIVKCDSHTTEVYLQHLGETKASKSTVEEAVNGLAWAHSVAGIASPTSSPFIQTTLEGLKRTLAKPVCKKPPFTAEMLQAIERDAKKTNTLTSLRLEAMFDKLLQDFSGLTNWPKSGHVT